MSRNDLIYSYPMVMDVAVALMLFVGRHSLATRGFDEATVGSVLLYYGIGYCISSLCMRHIVKVRYARWQMLTALTAVVVCCLWLAFTRSVPQIQLAFALVPVAFSLFFNAFQAFMLEISDGQAKPLAATAGHYTFSWSLGYALGPFVTGTCRRYLDWEPVYLVAAGLCLIIGLLVLLVSPTRNCGGRVAWPARPHRGHSLIGPAWVGVVLAWTGWNAVSTYWPVQAEQLGFSSAGKSAVEFAFALLQALSALALVHAGAWHHRPRLLGLFGAAGVAGVLLFAAAEGIGVFLVAALIYGAYTGSAFSFMVYHSMFDPEKAIRRVGLNETFVGLSFLAGPVGARVLHADTASFGQAYIMLAALLATGVMLETLYARYLDAGRTGQ